MRIHKTGHAIADTVSDLIGDLPDGSYNIAYGILRHNLFRDPSSIWFEVDKGFWGATHYQGNYRLSFLGTQPRYTRNSRELLEPHGQTLEPWRNQEGYALICPPTSHVCEFFGISQTDWLLKTLRNREIPYIIRHKGDEKPIEWDSISKLITFNSTLAVEALRRGIPVESDPEHSTIGSYLSTVDIKNLDTVNRDGLFSFMQAHQFRLHEKEKIECLINYYLTQFKHS